MGWNRNTWTRAYRPLVVVVGTRTRGIGTIEAERRPHLVDAEARRARDVLRVCGRREEGQESS